MVSEASPGPDRTGADAACNTRPDVLRLTEAVGLEAHEVVSVLERAPGSDPVGYRVRVAQLPQLIRPGMEVWFGATPLSLPPGRGRRGRAEDAERVAALVADIDVTHPGVKAVGGMPTFGDARAVIADLSGMLGSLPVVVVGSGHGLQPWWPVEHEDSRDIPAMTRRVERFNALVRQLAASRGGSADKLTDIARVWRMPGTENLKDPEDPVAVRVAFLAGRPLTGAEIDEALDAYLRETPSGGGSRSEQLTEPVETEALPWPDGDCGWATAVVGHWRKETVGARHPWLIARWSTLWNMRRYGCLTAASWHEASAVLAERFADAVARDRSGRKPSEFADARRDQLAYVSGLPADQVSEQLSGHIHQRTRPEVGQSQPDGQTRGTAGSVRFHWAIDDQPEEVEWLIDGFMPARCLNIVAGREGAGKSTLAARIIAMATRGELTGKPVKALVLGTEDGWRSRWIPRLHASGADLARVSRDPEYVKIDDDGEEVADLMSIADQRNLALLATAMSAEGIGLLYLDHLGDALAAGVDQNQYGHVTSALKAINRWAQANEITVLAGWHLTKGSGRVHDKLIGSVGFRTSARCVAVVAEDAQTGRRIIAVDKCNDLDVSRTPAKVFAIEEKPVLIDGKLFTANIASELGDHEDGCGRDTVQQLVDEASASDNPQQRETKTQLAAFIAEIITDAGGVIDADKGTAAVVARFGPTAKSTMKRARDRAGVVSEHKTDLAAGWVWRFREQTS